MWKDANAKALQQISLSTVCISVLHYIAVLAAIMYYLCDESKQNRINNKRQTCLRKSM